MINELLKLRQTVKKNKPLIHCITNHITANDCANMVLAVGATPIMAEFSKEVAEITRIASALAINLGSINNLKMEAISISGKTSKQYGIPSVIDLVGVGCSTLRLDFAREYISTCCPDVIKGNMSEIKAVCRIENNAVGVDVGGSDAITVRNIDNVIAMMKNLSAQTKAVIIATGVMDIIVYDQEAYIVKNGSEMLSVVCGTGCMLNVLIASFISTGHIVRGSILAVLLLGICGELSENKNGVGTFKTMLFDNVYSISDDIFAQKIKLEKR